MRTKRLLGAAFFTAPHLTSIVAANRRVVETRGESWNYHSPAFLLIALTHMLSILALTDRTCFASMLSTLLINVVQQVTKSRIAH